MCCSRSTRPPACAVSNVYGPGQDFIVIDTSTLPTPLYDVDGITSDPASGVLYAIANDPTANIGLGDRLVTINKATGAVTNIGLLVDAADGSTAVTDMEGLVVPCRAPFDRHDRRRELHCRTAQLGCG